MPSMTTFRYTLVYLIRYTPMAVYPIRYIGSHPAASPTRDRSSRAPFRSPFDSRSGGFPAPPYGKARPWWMRCSGGRAGWHRPTGAARAPRFVGRGAVVERAPPDRMLLEPREARMHAFLERLLSSQRVAGRPSRSTNSA